MKCTGVQLPQVRLLESQTSSQRFISDHIGGRSIVPHQIDLLQFGEVVSRPADTIVCMGDTLTHLSHEKVVRALFETVSKRLIPGGRFVLTWRDLSSPPSGLDRFIPVNDKVMICFLENCGQSVLVHDLIQERESDGWRLSKGVYPKLKLPLHSIAGWLDRAGFTIEVQGAERGMQIVAAVR